MLEKSNENSNLHDTAQYQEMVGYLKDKIDGLAEERMSWLAKFDQCSSRLNQKHNKQEKLKQLKDSVRHTDKSIIHHSVALYDERANAIALDRDNRALEFEDAEQIVKIK